MQSWKDSPGESIRGVRIGQEQKGQATAPPAVVSGPQKLSSTCRDLERRLSMNLETRQQFTIPWAHREQGLMAQGWRWVWPGLCGAGKLVFIHRGEEPWFLQASPEGHIELGKEKGFLGRR